MLGFNPYNPDQMACTLHKAVKKSGLGLAQIAIRLEQEYGVKLTVGGLSHVITRGTVPALSISHINALQFTLVNKQWPVTHLLKRAGCTKKLGCGG